MNKAQMTAEENAELVAKRQAEKLHRKALLENAALIGQRRRNSVKNAKSVLSESAERRDIQRANTPEIGSIDLIDDARSALTTINGRLFEEILRLRRELLSERRRTKAAIYQRKLAVNKMKSAKALLVKHQTDVAWTVIENATKNIDSKKCQCPEAVTD